MKQTLEHHEEEIKNQSLIIKQKKQEIDELKSDNEIQINQQKQNFEMKINELNKKIEMLQTELEQTKRMNENQRMKNEEENEKLKSEIKILKENEVKLKSQTDSKNIKTFTPTGNEGDDGIIRYLDGIAASKNDQHLINIYKSICCHFNIYKKLREKDEDIPMFKYTKKDGSLWILFDFKNFQIEISNYSIKSSIYSKDHTHIKSWSIEISNDTFPHKFLINAIFRPLFGLLICMKHDSYSFKFVIDKSQTNFEADNLKHFFVDFPLFCSKDIGSESKWEVIKGKSENKIKIILKIES